MTCENYTPVKQKYFDIMVTALINQGQPSINLEDSTCLYRARDAEGNLNGNKCAVGHLIPDLHYSRSMEERNSLSLLNDFAYRMLYIVVPETVGMNEYGKNHISHFIRDVQRCHDDSAMSLKGTFMDLFKAQAKILAGIHQLEWKYD